jgi:hypothetical protein
MSDKVMIEEFPKLEQRFAVCKIQWDAVEDEEEEDEDEDEEIEKRYGGEKNAV